MEIQKGRLAESPERGFFNMYTPINACLDFYIKLLTNS